MTSSQIKEKMIRIKPRAVKTIFQAFHFQIISHASSLFHSALFLNPPFFNIAANFTSFYDACQENVLMIRKLAFSALMMV